MKTSENALSIFALGGINEIGKNMYVIQYANDMFVIDCGSKFPDESLLGIDLIVQDVSYLLENKEKIKGLIITHGHEDHIGGIPFLLKQINLPIYATRLTIGLIELKLKEHGLLRETELILIDSNATIKFEEVDLTFFKTNHSIPDCLGIAFHTPVGIIVHTGDFKFDLTPVSGEYPEIHKMAEIGQKGVLLLLSESTNAERPGFTPTEKIVGNHIEEAFRKAKQKIFISTFASNVHRVQQIVDATEKTNRKLVLLGRSMVNVVAVAQELGYLHVPEDMMIDPSEVNRMDPDKVVILCTGSQGEPMAALARLASSNFRKVEVLRDDTVIFAASPIPGNEISVSRIIDNLFRLGAHVVYGNGEFTGMHVTGHACQEELKLMLTLIKPKYFIPIHGEYRMLHQHSLLAQSVGVEKENIFIIKNGDVVDINNGEARQTRSITSGNIFVDGLGIGDVGNIVLRDRKILSEEGMMMIVITINKSNGQLVSRPDTVSRGFVYVRDAEELINEVNDLVVSTLKNLPNANGVNQRSTLKKEIKDTVGKLLFSKTKRRPMIIPMIIEV